MAQPDSQSPESVALAKAEAHPLRVSILNAIGSGERSPNSIATELGAPLGNVSYHMKVLLELGSLELVKTEPRRGAVEHYYRLTGKVLPRLALPYDARKFLSRMLSTQLANGIKDTYPTITPVQLRELAEAEVELDPANSGNVPLEG